MTEDMKKLTEYLKRQTVEFTQVNKYNKPEKELSEKAQKIQDIIAFRGCWDSAENEIAEICSILLGEEITVSSVGEAKFIKGSVIVPLNDIGEHIGEHNYTIDAPTICIQVKNRYCFPIDGAWDAGNRLYPMKPNLRPATGEEIEILVERMIEADENEDTADTPISTLFELLNVVLL